MALDKESLEELTRLEEDMTKLSAGKDEDRRNRANGLFQKNPSNDEKKRIGIVKAYFSGDKKAPSKSTIVTIDLPDSSEAEVVCKQLQMVFTSEDIKWNRVIHNMLWLGESVSWGGTYYRGFFKEVLILLEHISEEHILQLKPGIESLLGPKKLSGTSDKENSLGNYKGAAAELLDALRSAAIHGLSLLSITLPQSMIDIAEDLTQAKPLKEGSKPLSAQDIDRLEILEDGTMVYIEVKADVETAIDKHGKGFAKLQLLQILNVIATDEREDTRRGVERVRLPAVSILNCAEWLRLFTAGTARIYAMLGFYLCIGGVIFSPRELNKISSVIASEMEGREKQFFHANVVEFPAPSVVRYRIHDIKSLLVLEKLPKPEDTAKVRFTDSKTKWNVKEEDSSDERGIHLLNAKEDPIVIKSNRPTGKFGPIGRSKSPSLLCKSDKEVGIHLLKSQDDPIVNESNRSTGKFGPIGPPKSSSVFGKSKVSSPKKVTQIDIGTLTVLNDGLPGMATDGDFFEGGSVVRVPCLAQGRASCGQRAVYNALALRNSYDSNSLLRALMNDRVMRSLGPLEEDIHSGQVRDMLDKYGGDDIIVIQDFEEIPILAGVLEHEILKPSAAFIAFLLGKTNVLHIVLNTRAPNAYGSGGSGHWIAVELVRARPNSNEVRVTYADSLQTENHDRSRLLACLLYMLGLSLPRTEKL